MNSPFVGGENVRLSSPSPFPSIVDGGWAKKAPLVASSKVADLTTTWQGLEEIVAAHNMKEERIVYPSGDEMLSADDAAEVLAELASEQTPEGWACEQAGRG